MKYLLIGGCADGQWADTNGSPDWNQMAPMSTPRFVPGDMSKMEEPRLEQSYSRYRRIKFRAGGSETFVYLADELRKGAQGEDADEIALHALISGYKAGSDDVPAEQEELSPPPKRAGGYFADLEDLERYAPDVSELERRVEMEEKRRAERLGRPRPRIYGMDMGRGTPYSQQELLALYDLIKSVPGAEEQILSMIGKSAYRELMLMIGEAKSRDEFQQAERKMRRDPPAPEDYKKHDPTKDTRRYRK